MYFLCLDPASGKLLRLWMTPMQLRRLRLNRAEAADVAWLQRLLDRETRHLGGGRVEANPDGTLELRW
jgi:poly-gamma-glutamate synthesis protein (capsule biosynthesis protein)